MSSRVAVSLLVFVMIFFSRVSEAYTPSRALNGASVKWEGADVYLKFVGNPTNRIGLSDSQFKESVVRGLQRWKAASLGGVRFDYWQGTDKSVFAPNSEYNQKSSIYFASNTSGSSGSNPAVVGLTQVWYDTNTGKIFEADVVLNDVDHRITTSARDSISGATVQGPTGAVYLDSVVTHELGHVMGLSHSQAMQSSMFFTESPEQSQLGCDDQIGIQSLYGLGGSSRSVLSGTIQGPAGEPIFGANVVAISARRGTVMATALTEPNGTFRIRSLLQGPYFLMVEPFYSGGANLSNYFGSISSNVCPGGVFSRTFKMASANRPEIVGVNEGERDVGTIQVQCTSGAAVNPSSAAGGFSVAPVIYAGSSPYFGFVDQLQVGSTHHYRIQNISGKLEVKLLGYALYSGVDTDVKLLDVAGNPVSAQLVGDLYSGESGFVNRDGALVAEALPLGEYVLAVTAKRIYSQSLPGGNVTYDSKPFIVISGVVNGSNPDVTNELAYNVRCKAADQFENYNDPVDPPPGSTSANSEIDSEKSGGFLGFCGTIAGGGTGSGGAGYRGMRPGNIASWLAPWLFMLGVLGLRIRSLKINFRL